MKHILTPNFFFIVMSVLFIFVLIIFSLLGSLHFIKETITAKKRAAAVLNNELMPSKSKQKKADARLVGHGLRTKFILFALILAISIILIIGIPLQIKFSQAQKKLLADNLLSRLNILLENTAFLGQQYIPEKKILELDLLLNQIILMKEAEYVIITGENPSANENEKGLDFILATNTEEIKNEINTPYYIQGKSRFIHKGVPEIIKKITKVNIKAQNAAEYIDTGLKYLAEEQEVSKFPTNSEELKRYSEVYDMFIQIEAQLYRKFSEIADEAVGSYPAYDATDISPKNTEYLFYKPILYRQGQETKNFVHGIVFIKVSTKTLLEKIISEKNKLIKIIFFISFIAFAVGIIGAYILASIIITPIRQLVSHVAMIRDTEKKETLAEKLIQIKGKNEIAMLGSTINDLTEALAQAAIVSKDLIVGKEIQKMFIPLEKNSDGRKLTSGYTSDTHVEFFGYYEGAVGVSGDYFDYIKLDEKYYAIIKCDVAGKGVPAALIMVEIATLFQNFFKDWSFEKHGINLDSIVFRINDLIEARGFKGRFAAFTLCVFNAESGEAFFCNAGDNIIHIYDAQAKKMKQITLHQSAAAGVFESEELKKRGGFKIEKITMGKGDVLFLFTDGIEEAKRFFRNEQFKRTDYDNAEFASDNKRIMHQVGVDSEELGTDRVHKIIESVFNNKKFSLKKLHDPIPCERFDFDFSACRGTVTEVVLALISVEQVFRMYKPDTATAFDKIRVDKKVDMFLSKYFLQYPQYCSYKQKNTEFEEYLYYSYVKEDEQYDDLTILGIMKK
ncbi:SpoIIE family protein phosphatase [Treponema phagedenis]|uniref:SpoIIE family protein phosphatase n=1 Tax=Treponema phagedenis TaxID=162 RepID=UPI00158237E1|nr:SpoIIE family protein phosphatase [Treponema phagedenis]NVP24634.1 SpoIIE family protein phosphatase [Treponema phagedenis]QKS91905.1 SpoIIE family protein phosphatase [Treponema phagedenis]QLC58832.1 SpoIIE family protein phosphatase [Treponema phagedenis]